MIKTIILTSSSAHGLVEKIEKHEDEGFEILGSHKVVNKHAQLRYSGMQHKDTVYEVEYSITMKLKEE